MPLVRCALRGRGRRRADHDEAGLAGACAETAAARRAAPAVPELHDVERRELQVLRAVRDPADGRRRRPASENFRVAGGQAGGEARCRRSQVTPGGKSGAFRREAPRFPPRSRRWSGRADADHSERSSHARPRRDRQAARGGAAGAPAAPQARAGDPSPGSSDAAEGGRAPSACADQRDRPGRQPLRRLRPHPAGDARRARRRRRRGEARQGPVRRGHARGVQVRRRPAHRAGRRHRQRRLPLVQGAPAPVGRRAAHRAAAPAAPTRGTSRAPCSCSRGAARATCSR